MILNVISGFSAKIRSDPGISDMVKSMAAGYAPDDVVSILRSCDMNFAYSADGDCIEESIRFMNQKAGNGVMLVGKSLGGIRTYWIMKRYWTYLAARMAVSARARLGIVLVDPHGWQMGDHKAGSYGVRWNLSYEEEWNNPKVKIHILYQRNKYPKGAAMKIPSGVENVVVRRLGKDADHWNITDIRTRPGQEVAGAISDMARWVKGAE